MERENWIVPPPVIISIENAPHILILFSKYKKATIGHDAKM